MEKQLRDAIWEAVNLNKKKDDVGKEDSEEKKNSNSFDIKKINSIICVCEKSRYLHIPQELRIRSGGTERHSASN